MVAGFDHHLTKPVDPEKPEVLIDARKAELQLFDAPNPGFYQAIISCSVR